MSVLPWGIGSCALGLVVPLGENHGAKFFGAVKFSSEVRTDKFVADGGVRVAAQEVADKCGWWGLVLCEYDPSVFCKNILDDDIRFEALAAEDTRCARLGDIVVFGGGCFHSALDESEVHGETFSWAGRYMTSVDVTVGRVGETTGDAAWAGTDCSVCGRRQLGDPVSTL